MKQKKLGIGMGRGSLHRLVRCLVEITEQRTKNPKRLYSILRGSRMIMQLSRDYDPLFSGVGSPQAASHAQPASGPPSRDQVRVAGTARARVRSKRQSEQRVEHDEPSKQRPACPKTALSRARRPTSSNENKMSDGGRGRASLGVEVWKSSQKWSVQRSAVRSIAWLDLLFIALRPATVSSRLFAIHLGACEGNIGHQRARRRGQHER